MAFIDYGAMIWKNGKLLDNSDDNYDTSRVLRKGKWLRSEDLPEDFDDKDCVVASGHAVIPLDNYCVAVYKNWSIRILRYENKGVVSCYGTCVDSKSLIGDESFGDIDFSSYLIDSYNSILYLEFTYAKDHYLIISGSNMGYGFGEKRNVTKFLKKVVDYKNDVYYFNTEEHYKFFDVTLILDYMIRRDDIRFEKHMMWEYGIKSLFRDLAHFRFDNIPFDLEKIFEEKKHIKYLK